MKIKTLMNLNPITITEDATIVDAIDLMKVNSIRHLPVISGEKTLEGFLTLADLRLGMIPSLVGTVSLRDLIIRHPICVSPDDDIEVAAQLIYKHKISGMPVVQSSDMLVGIITETDILRAFIDMMGILTASSRIDVVIDNKPGAFNKVVQIIQDNGGDIINVGMTARQSQKKTYFFRLSSCKTDVLRSILEKEGFTVSEAMD